VPAIASSLTRTVRQRLYQVDVGPASRLEHDLATLRTCHDVDSPVVDCPSLADDALFLQFSGGTTGVQKCVAVTRTMLDQQLSRLSRTLRLSSDDAIVSWLPLYHDMGLIANLWLPLFAQIPSTHIAASDWVLQPELLLTLLDEHRGTLCWLPNFAFSYLARRRPHMQKPYSLGHVRGWISCSEPVRKTSMTSFVEAFRDFGVRTDTLHASYAMAENVFAVTQTDLTCPPRYIGEYASSGRALPGTRIRLDDRGGIEISTPSLFDGYWTATGTPRTAFTDDGWYVTGDRGFLDNGELFVVGRLKDLIIVGGQNVFPEDVEAVVANAQDVHPGRAVAFGVDDDVLGTQSIAVVAELTGEYGEDRAAAVEAEIRALVAAGIGVAPRHVAVVPRQWIVKSTAGKISRHDTRLRFLQEYPNA
jgi:acyl-CoA synthetase (AMP-forming)/AMP-acid ligase II